MNETEGAREAMMRSLVFGRASLRAQIIVADRHDHAAGDRMRTLKKNQCRVCRGRRMPHVCLSLIITVVGMGFGAVRNMWHVTAYSSCVLPQLIHDATLAPVQQP